MATPISAVLIDGSGGNDSITVNVPATCTGIAAFSSHWDGDSNSSLATLTLDGDSFTREDFLANNSTDSAVSAWLLENPSTGNGLTLAWTFSAGGARSEGGGIVLVFLSDVNTGDALRAADVNQAATTTPAPVSGTCEVGDTVLVFAQRFDSANAEPAAITDVLSYVLQDEFLNSESYSVGTIAAASPTVTATMDEWDYSTMALLVFKPAVAGDHSASGAATLGALTASGAGKVRRIASGAANVPTLVGSGAAIVRRLASGAGSIPAITASGTGKVRRSASGSATIPSLTANGTAKLKKLAAGAATLAALTAAGTASVNPPPDGGGDHAAAGAATVPSLQASGSARVIRRASGSAVIAALSAASVSVLKRRASGSANIAALTASAAARRKIVANGTITIPALTASGTGRRKVHSSGSASLAALIAQGVVGGTVIVDILEVDGYVIALTVTGYRLITMPIDGFMLDD